MTAALKAQLLASMRKSVKELGEKIKQAEAHAGRMSSAKNVPDFSYCYTQAWDKVETLQDERDALIRRIEAAEEADDLINDLLNAINDAYDGEPLTAGSLQAQLDNYKLVVSRAPLVETKPTLEEQRASFARLRETIKGWRK